MGNYFHRFSWVVSILIFTLFVNSCGRSVKLQRQTVLIPGAGQVSEPFNIESIPDLNGYGKVPNFSLAVENDASGELKALAEKFIKLSDPSARSVIMDRILFKWTGSDWIAPNKNGLYIDARKLAVLEKIVGKQFTSVYGPNPVYESAIELKKAYRELFEMYYGRLMAGTHLKRLYSMTTYQCDKEKRAPKRSLSDVIKVIRNDLTSNPEIGRSELGEFARTLRGMKILEKFDYLSFKEVFISMDPDLGWVMDSAGLPIYDNVHQGYLRNSLHIEGTDDADAVKGSLTKGDGYLHGENGEDVIYGTSRDEILINSSGDAVMVGGGGNDIIWAWEDDDVIDGGTGNDMLYGGTGNDIYIFRIGSGQDVIIDNDSDPANNDTIWLGGTLTPSDISVNRQSNDLILHIKNTSDMMTVKDYFLDDLNVIEEVRFPDDTVWTKSDIMDQINSSAEKDNIFKDNDRLNGTGENDILSGKAGDDILNGSVRDDIIYGGSGNDTLDGGSGNDMLYGEEGNDTYLFGRGSNYDIIYDRDRTPGNIDTIMLGSGIMPADINIRRNCDNLVLRISNSNDSLTVSNFFTGVSGDYQIERIQFSDGTVWDVNKIKQLVLKVTPGKTTIAGYSTSDVIRGMDGDDCISAGGGDDTLYGGKGNDELTGDDGNDSLYGEAGDDRLFGGAGDDVLYGGPGNDTVNGGGGDDTLDGGPGNDMLYGEEGNDTYLFGRGDGQDTIFDDDKTSGNKDTILLKSKINPSDVTLRRDRVNLVLEIKGTKDKVTIGNWFLNDSDEFRIEQIRFPDGIVWDEEKIKQLALQAVLLKKP
jgi:Ca2+-binding RTX toxin-like protein